MDPSRALPCATVLVSAQLLLVGPSEAATPPATTDAADTDEVPPPGDAVETGQEFGPEVRVPVAPTCGPCCHGSSDPRCGPGVIPPPTVPPSTQKGCAIDPGAPRDPFELAMLVLVLAAARRRQG